MEHIILVVGTDQENLDLISLLAEGEFNFRVIATENQEKAIKTIEALGTKLVGVINLIDIRDVLSSPVYEKSYKVRKCPYLHVLDVQSIEPKNYETYFSQSAYNFLVSKQSLYKELKEFFSKIESRYDINDSSIRPMTKEGKPLYRMNIKRFLAMRDTKDDIFIRIGQGKFLKLYHAGDSIDHSQIIEYQQRGEKYLFQAEEDFKNTVNKTLDTLKGKYKKNLDKSQTVALQLATIKEVQDVVRNMGITQNIIDTTDELVGSVEKMLSDSKELKSIVKKLLSLKSRFFTRTSLCNYFLAGIAKKMGWESHQTLKKLIYASVYCDFSFELPESHLAEVLSIEDSSFKKLSKVAQLRVKSHPKLSAAILEKGNGIMTDEATIIKHHHEKPDGTGFPEGLDYKTIPVLSCAFILAYDFSTMLIKSFDNPDDIDGLAVLEALGEDYSKANFNKPYNCLKELLK